MGYVTPMSHPRTYTREIADPPEWMDEEERAIRENVMNDMVELTQRRGSVPAVVGELLARYLEGEFDDAQLFCEFEKAYRSRCH